MSQSTIAPRAHTRRIVYVATILVVLLVISALIYAFESSRDSDCDGLTDTEERSGWQTLDGNTYLTDPQKIDTDGDGLTDSQEAGESLTSPEGVRVYAGLSNPTARDTDGDQLEDWAETLGWTSFDGTTFLTEPKIADSDGDGLLDGWEAGSPVGPQSRAPVFALSSNPLDADSDGDGLSDAEEADLSLNPFSPDTDADGLTDLAEVEIIGTDADLADSDGDGFDDAYEVSNIEARGLNPLRPDLKEDARAYALEFARGAFAGDASPGDSVAWLAGNLASGALSSVPVVGWAIGGVADVRDAIASSIRADWVGATYSGIGMIPTAGDAVVVPLKIAKFLMKHPKHVTEVSQFIARSGWIPEGTQIRVIAAAAPEAWDTLSAKTSTKVLLDLVVGGTNLSSLANSMARANHIIGSRAPSASTLSSAEVELANILDRDSATPPKINIVFPTSDCLMGCNDTARRVDLLADGIAHEAKWGYVALTPSIASQIRSDGYLIESGQLDGAQWHFFGSSESNLIGASVDVLNLLDEFDIPYTIHLPK
ncbi:MAG: hypothetical protein WBA87_12475 [Microbacterium sp.]